MDVLGPVRRFLDWERRVFLGEEDWEFPTARDMPGLIEVFDQRFRRHSARGNRTIWRGPWRALWVRATPPDQIEVFWHWGYWSPIPRLLGGLYFDGPLSATASGGAIAGRLRQPAISRAFLLVVANLAALWLLLVVVSVARYVVRCSTFDGSSCLAVTDAIIFVGLGILVVGIMFVVMKSGFGLSHFIKRRIRALLTDLAGNCVPI